VIAKTLYCIKIYTFDIGFNRDIVFSKKPFNCVTVYIVKIYTLFNIRVLFKFFSEIKTN